MNPKKTYEMELNTLLNTLKNNQRRLLFKQEEKIAMLKHLDGEGRGKEYFDVFKQFENIQEELRINVLDIQDTEDKLGEL